MSAFSMFNKQQKKDEQDNKEFMGLCKTLYLITEIAISSGVCLVTTTAGERNQNCSCGLKEAAVWLNHDLIRFMDGGIWSR